MFKLYVKGKCMFSAKEPTKHHLSNETDLRVSEVKDT